MQFLRLCVCCCMVCALCALFSPLFSVSAAEPIKITVTEKIPGQTCTLVGDGKDITTRKYECTVKSGFSSVMGIMGVMIKYFTFITAILGMLMIIISGMQYATSAGDGDTQKKAILRIQKLIGGLLLLFFSGLLLNTIAPWIYK